MTKVIRHFLAAIIGFGLVVSTAILSPLEASAGENMGRVRNYTGNLVKIACEYGHPSDTLEEKYPEPGSNSTEFCPLDTDQFKAMYDKRCMKYIGPGAADGWYQLKPNVWRKVSGLALVKVFAWTEDRCGSKAYFNKT